MSNDNKLPSVNKGKEEKEALDYKERFLGNVSQRFTGEETARWLSALNDAEKLVEESVKATKEAHVPGLTVFTLIDRLFDNFQRYSFEFNKNCQGTKYAVSVERPAGIKEKRTWGTDQVDRYSIGRLAAMEWGLLVLGQKERLTAFVMQTKHLLSFNPEEHNHEPYMVIEESKKGWEIDGQPIAVDSVPSIARCLFSHLVMVARGEAGPNERFSLARAQAAPPIPIGTASHPFLREHAQAEESFSLQKAAQGVDSGTTSQSLKKPSAANMGLEENNSFVGTNVTQLMSAIDRQLEVLPEISAQCMRTQNMVGVVQCMKRSQALTNLKAKLVEFRDEWLGILKERE